MSLKKAACVIGVCALLLAAAFFVRYPNHTFLTLEEIASQDVLEKALRYDDQPLRFNSIDFAQSDSGSFAAVSGQLAKGKLTLNYITIYSRVPLTARYYCEFHSVYTVEKTDTGSCIFASEDLAQSWLFKYSLAVYPDRIDVTRHFYFGNILYAVLVFALVFLLRRLKKSRSSP